MAESFELQILSIGLDETSAMFLRRFMPAEKIIEKPYDLEKLIEEPVEPPPGVVFCGLAPEGISIIEVAQTLRMQYQESGIFLMTTIRAGFDRKEFMKNGFSDAFLLPLDGPNAEQIIRDEIARVSKGKVKSYRKVKMIDVQAGVSLDFDTYIYMPANKKHIKYSASGDELDPERAERLKKHQVQNLQVTSDQISKFYEFTATQLKKLGQNNAMSETERREKMQTAVRDLIGDMFNDSSKDASTVHGKEIVSDCQEIVKAYVLDAGASNQNAWYSKVLAVTGADANNYSHAANVSTYAALFSLGMGLGDASTVALAGILHDIGLADVPPEIQMKEKNEWSKEDFEKFKEHVEHSVKMIRERKLVVSDIVTKAIQQHHERWNGSGYPKGLVGKRICIEAQLLGLADEFDYMTAAIGGKKPKMTPSEAIDYFKSSLGNPSSQEFDPELIRKLVTLFPTAPKEPNAEATAAAPVA